MNVICTRFVKCVTQLDIILNFERKESTPINVKQFQFIHPSIYPLSRFLCVCGVCVPVAAAIESIQIQ